MKRRKMSQTEGGGWKTLQILNIGDDTSPRDLVELFSRGQFDLSGAYVEFIGLPDSCLVQGFISVCEREATKAKKWANGKLWRGKKLDVAINDLSRASPEIGARTALERKGVESESARLSTRSRVNYVNK